MRALNPRRLEHFLAIVRAGKLSRAADLLDLSQPVLSRELKELETELGVTLLRRHARGVELTGAGKAFKRKAEHIVELMASLPQGLGAADEEPTGRLAVGMPVSMSAMVTGPLLAAYRAAHPHVRLHIREAMSSQLHEALVQRDIDVAVLAAPVSDPQLVCTPFVTEPMVLIGPPGSSLSARRPVSLQTLGSHELILPASPHSARFMVESALATIGVKPRISIEADIAPLAYFVTHGLGYSVVPSCAVLNMGMVASGMKFAPIKGMHISWTIARPAGVEPSLAAVLLQESLVELARSRIGARRWRATLQEPADAGPATGRPTKP